MYVYDYDVLNSATLHLTQWTHSTMKSSSVLSLENLINYNVIYCNQAIIDFISSQANDKLNKHVLKLIVTLQIEYELLKLYEANIKDFKE